MSCCSDVMEPIEVSSCCTPQDTAAQAARAMRDSGCGCAPVIEDTENLKLVGVVTERDVCCGMAADDRRASEVRVEEIIAKLTTAPGNRAATGGLKVITENGWFAARPSGTENVYKIYAESFRDAAHLRRIQDEAQSLVAGILTGQQTKEVGSAGGV